MNETQFIEGPNGYKLAYVFIPPKNTDRPGVVFLGGFKSDMAGSKALFLQELCEKEGLGYLRLDYGGHGESGGNFIDGCISEWFEDAKHLFDTLTTGPQIVIGSSMGGWISYLLAQDRADLIAGLISLAPALDFTKEVLERASEEQRQDLKTKNRIEEPSEYSDEPYIFTKKLLEDGEKVSLLDTEISYNGPVRILHGTKDTAVPINKPRRIRAALNSQDVEISYIEGSDHRLSSPSDLEILKSKVLELTA